jgi:peptidoglycan hydrolase-like protein with peptidoglycan-binding domain
MKQYEGGHNETWGGVTINIDRDFLDLGNPSAPAESHCGGVPVDFTDYVGLTATTTRTDLVKSLQCLLTEQQAYAGPVDGTWSPAVLAAVNAWQTAHAMPARPRWNRQNWMSLFAAGVHPILKFGTTGSAVRDLQRALNAANGAHLTVSGMFTTRTDVALRTWQTAIGTTASGVADPSTWRQLATGKRPSAG